MIHRYICRREKNTCKNLRESEGSNGENPANWLVADEEHLAESVPPLLQVLKPGHDWTGESLSMVFECVLQSLV